MCESNMAALLRETPLFVLCDEFDSPVAPSDFGRLVSGYRLTQTAWWFGTATATSDIDFETN